MNDNEWLQFKTRFPSLSAGRTAATLVRERAIVKRAPAGEILYRDGDDCLYLPMVLNGEVALSKYGETGRAITLYRIGTGESCILSTLSILTNKRFPAEAAIEEAATVVLIPAETVRKLIESEPTWRMFAFELYQSRLANLIGLIEEIVFARLDVRLAESLLDTADDDGRVARTHQAVAATLGSSREVVSRLLKEWERRGVVALSRGHVEIQDRRFLEELSAKRE